MDVLQKIENLKKMRGWTEYKLYKALKMLEIWTALSPKQKEASMSLLKSMLEAPNE